MERGCTGGQNQTLDQNDADWKLWYENTSTAKPGGQKDDLILGSNVIKYLMHEMKCSNDYWRLTAQNCDMSESPDTSQFLDMMAGVTRWQGAEIPSKIGTVKLTQAVTLLARHEHLVWVRLPKNTLMSPGSTVIVEPTSSKSMPRKILVGQVITPMWGDGYIPMKIMNLSDQPVTLKRKCKLADVSPCVAVEDFTVFQNTSQVETMDHLAACLESNCKDFEETLANVGLKGIDINSCQVSHSTKKGLVQLLVSYNDIFSKHALDCGEAKGFSHRIHLVDERPFHLPYRRVPPAHYQKLRQALTEMEDQGIIRKSTSEFASPLVMVWKKDGSLRNCTDFRWLNARTLKAVHPLPHQSDCLASLGGNVFFSTMDLTSGFYNMPMHEEDKKYTAFITPLCLDEYNRMPQGLCNSPTSFMRMMLCIFGDLKFTQLLCYLDDLLVFAATEEEALTHNNWELAAESRAVQFIQSVQQFAASSLDTLPELSLLKLQQRQEQDPSIAVVVPFVTRRRRPSRREKANLNPSALSLSKQWDRLTSLNGILYRVIKDPMSKQKQYQYVLPQSLKAEALSGIHNLAGHQGQARTLHLARQRFYWPKMEQDIKSYVKCCQRCILAKSPEPSARAPLESIRTSAPMELVCLDFWSSEDSKQNSVDVLVVTDHFTKLAHAFPCANQTAKQVARKLWDHVFCVYGFPKRIHTYHGANFESGLIAELLKLSGVVKSHTTANHPMGNGGTERFNRTLGAMLCSLPLKAKHQWPQQIQFLTFAYNATVHETIGFPPFYLMFGRVLRLPVDVMFKQEEASIITQQHSAKEQQKQAQGYNKRVKGTHLNVGDHVLIANKGERGKRKLADKWEANVFVVINRNPQTQTYVVQDEKGAKRVVHRNLLLDISFLPVQEELGGTHNPDPDECDDEWESVANSQPQDLADCLVSENSERRTSLWVLDETEHSLGQSSQSETGSVQFGEQQTQGDDCSEKSSEDESHITEPRSGQMDCFNLDSDITTPIMETRVMSQTEQPNHVTEDRDTQGVENTQERVTHASRVVKKVNRLIESMDVLFNGPKHYGSKMDQQRTLSTHSLLTLERYLDDPWEILL
ncbi:hypothetical protein QQF64_020053 [Cirrhinus molitorella]|uniref:Gypsy retrotransposon integrase-like protein 1 n=1 Tax=Cirrhinus molitorella TaxID=172907 RepID=A0ABR3LH88_9TELE